LDFTKTSQRFAIEVPLNFQELKKSDMLLAKAARERSRIVLESALSQGRKIVDFELNEAKNKGYYLTD
jgi:hypothetical protein